MTFAVLMGNVVFIVIDLLFALHGASFGNGLVIVIVYIILSVIYYVSIPTFVHVQMSNKTAIGPYTSINATYTAILADPISRYCLMFHMRDLHLEENIYYFLDSIKFFKIANNPNTDKKKLKVYTQKMIDKYIKDDGKYQVNISDSLKEEILKTAAEQEPDHQLFEKVDEEVLQLIIQNCGQSFLGSIHASKAKDLLRWFNGFEQMNPELQDAVVEKVVGYKEEQRNKNQEGDKEGGYSVFTKNESADLAFQSIQYSTLTQRTTKTVLIKTCGSHTTSLNPRVSNTGSIAHKGGNRASHTHAINTTTTPSRNSHVKYGSLSQAKLESNKSKTGLETPFSPDKSITGLETPLSPEKSGIESEKKSIKTETELNDLRSNAPLQIVVNTTPVEPLAPLTSS